MPASMGPAWPGPFTRSVLWPKAAGNVKWPDGMDVYPKTFPPLRSDRDTVLVGTTKSTAAKHVEIDVDGPAGAQTLAWDIPALKSDAANGYLVTLVDQAKCDGGRTLPLIDSASLATAKQEIEAGGRGLAYLGREALKGGNLETPPIVWRARPCAAIPTTWPPGDQGRHRQEGRWRRFRSARAGGRARRARIAPARGRSRAT